MKKIILILTLCFSFLTLTACTKEEPSNEETNKVVREEEGIMQDLIDGVKSVFE